MVLLKRFFVYLSDLDFSLRARRIGAESFYLTDTHIYHRGGGSSHQIKARSLYYSLTSRILYGFKHFRLLDSDRAFRGDAASRAVSSCPRDRPGLSDASWGDPGAYACRGAPF